MKKPTRLEAFHRLHEHVQMALNKNLDSQAWLKDAQPIMETFETDVAMLRAAAQQALPVVAQHDYLTRDSIGLRHHVFPFDNNKPEHAGLQKRDGLTMMMFAIWGGSGWLSSLIPKSVLSQESHWHDLIGQRAWQDASTAQQVINWIINLSRPDEEGRIPLSSFSQETLQAIGKVVVEDFEPNLYVQGWKALRNEHAWLPVNRFIDVQAKKGTVLPLSSWFVEDGSTLVQERWVWNSTWVDGTWRDTEGGGEGFGKRSKYGEVMNFPTLVAQHQACIGGLTADQDWLERLWSRYHQEMEAVPDGHMVILASVLTIQVQASLPVLAKTLGWEEERLMAEQERWRQRRIESQLHLLAEKLKNVPLESLSCKDLQIEAAPPGWNEAGIAFLQEIGEAIKGMEVLRALKKMDEESHEQQKEPWSWRVWEVLGEKAPVLFADPKLPPDIRHWMSQGREYAHREGWFGANWMSWMLNSEFAKWSQSQAHLDMDKMLSPDSANHGWFARLWQEGNDSRSIKQGLFQSFAYFLRGQRDYPFALDAPKESLDFKPTFQKTMMEIREHAWNLDPEECQGYQQYLVDLLGEEQRKQTWHPLLQVFSSGRSLPRLHDKAKELLKQKLPKAWWGGSKAPLEEQWTKVTMAVWLVEQILDEHVTSDKEVYNKLLDVYMPKLLTSVQEWTKTLNPEDQSRWASLGVWDRWADKQETVTKNRTDDMVKSVERRIRAEVTQWRSSTMQHAWAASGEEASPKKPKARF